MEKSGSEPRTEKLGSDLWVQFPFWCLLSPATCAVLPNMTADYEQAGTTAHPKVMETGD